MFAFLALARTGARGELSQRLKRLEDEIAELKRALTEARGGAPATPRGTQAEPAAFDESLAPTEAAAWLPSTPEPLEPPEEGPLPEAAGARPSAPSLSAPAPTGPVEPRADAPPAAGGGGRPGIEWEQWLGVRGAAVLGGAVLALAGLLFFRYSIEHGLIPPWLRVVMGTATGIAAIAAAEWTLRREYAGTANALAGGGLVVLYAAFWAAGVLYGLVPPGALFVLMVAVTVAGCALSWRHESLVIAIIGLVGGFLTPLFASTGSDRPIGLFGYVLVLDCGLLYVARRKRWPVLAALALVGTSLYQVLWIGGRMGAERTLLGLAILAVFALVFALAAPRETGASEARTWRWSQRAAVLLPFVFGLYFAGRANLDTSIVRLGGLLAILGVAAGWLARRGGEPQLALGAAAATVAVALVWTVQHPLLGGTPWAVSVMFAILALAHHAALELGRMESGAAGALGRTRDAGGIESAARDPRELVRKTLADAAALVGLGLLGLLVVAGGSGPLAFWPLLAGWLGLAAILVRQGAFEGRGRVQIATAAAVALGLAWYRSAHPAGTAEELPQVAGPATVLAVMLVVAIAWQGLAIAQARLASARIAEHAASMLALVLLLSLLADQPGTPAVGFGASFAFGLLIALSATRAGGGPWLAVAALATALVQFGWTMDFHPRASLAALALAALSSVAFTAWPLVIARRLLDDRWAWRAAALAGVAWFPALVVLWENWAGDGAIAVVPLGLAAVSVAAAARARGLWPSDDPRRTSALAWLCGAALGFATVAIPLQLEKEWITIGWALEGAALLGLWQRLDHPGLKYTAIALLGAVAVRLVGNPEVLAYHPRGVWRIVNWLAYAYLVPAAALVFASRVLGALELIRLRAWERPLYARLREKPIGAAATGLAALVVVFVWINLAIADWYSTGDALELVIARTQAEKLTTSIAWVLYALAILILGVRQQSGGLRWASLVLLMGTIAKIFLYDLGELRDLYRVAALLGLALSLIVVSLVYQRFLFRRPGAESGET